jgi:hypothetical protein
MDDHLFRSTGVAPPPDMLNHFSIKRISQVLPGAMFQNHSATSVAVRLNAAKSFGQGDRHSSQVDFLFQDSIASSDLHFQEGNQIGLYEVTTGPRCASGMAEHASIIPSKGVHELEEFLHLGSNVDPTSSFICRDKVSSFGLTRPRG